MICYVDIFMILRCKNLVPFKNNIFKFVEFVYFSDRFCVLPRLELQEQFAVLDTAACTVSWCCHCWGSSRDGHDGVDVEGLNYVKLCNCVTNESFNNSLYV